MNLINEIAITHLFRNLYSNTEILFSYKRLLKNLRISFFKLIYPINILILHFQEIKLINWIKHLAIIGLLLNEFSVNKISAQSRLNLKDVSKSCQSLYQKGVNEYKLDQYKKAIPYFEKAIKKCPLFIDAELQWASVCYDMEDYECAENHFERVLQLDSMFNFKVFYTLALVQYKLNKFQKAKANMKIYLSLENKNQDLINKARYLYPKISFADSATRVPLKVTSEIIKPLQTQFSEYLPSFTADGKIVVFTRRSFRNDEDLYFSRFIDNNWSEPLPIEELNTPLNEGSPAISPDGNTIVFTSCDRKNSLGGCDLYITEKKGNHWTEPYNMGDKINSASYETQPCFSNNGNTIYFTSNRTGTHGGFDIWMSKRKTDNSWTTAKNLGAPVNSTGNEDCPYIHPNGQVLYFSSDFPPGMGGKDLFYSIQDSKGQWQEPINLGYPINSKGDESSFIVFPDGEKAWYASDQYYYQNNSPENLYNLDLYQIYLPENLKVKPSTSIEIFIREKDTKKAISAEVSIFDLKNNVIYYNKKVDTSGHILISLPTGASYGLHIYNKDYLFVPDHIDCSEFRKRYEPILIEKWMEKINLTNGNPIILKNLYFEVGSYQIRPESYFELDELVQFLNDHKKLKLKITGHTDNVGSDFENLILSDSRAAAVVLYIVSKGILQSRLSYEGKGERMPYQSNETEEGRAANRRIEFTIIDK